MIPIRLLLGESLGSELVDRSVVEAVAMQAVMQAETELGNHPRDLSSQNLGYGIERLDPRTGRLCPIEVKGRRVGVETVFVTRNEILAGLNSSGQYIPANVEVVDGEPRPPRVGATIVRQRTGS